MLKKSIGIFALIFALIGGMFTVSTSAASFVKNIQQKQNGKMMGKKMTMKKKKRSKKSSMKMRSKMMKSSKMKSDTMMKDDTMMKKP